MILVEHAVLVTMDPSRRIFLDGSVLMDGERIVQVGQSRNVRPPRAPESVIVARFSPASRGWRAPACRAWDSRPGPNGR